MCPSPSEILAPYLVCGRFLYEGQDRGVVQIPSSPHLQVLKHLIYDGRDRKDYPVLPSRRERYPQILVVQFYPKAGIEGMLEHLLPLDLHDFVAGEPPAEYV